MPLGKAERDSRASRGRGAPGRLRDYDSVSRVGMYGMRQLS
jgi:hypothetical protein